MINKLEESNKSEKIWGVLMHLSFNFAGGIAKWGGLRKEFEPDMDLWDTAINKMAEAGVNMVVINLDDSILWQSHPEISLKNAWTPKRLREELAKIRNLGIEPIPMLNFSTAHDAWLGEYSNMVSSKLYYKVCSNLINEAIDLFGAPSYFHIGMDEETFLHQRHFDHIIIRQKELWWGDLYFFISEIMKRRVRPWVWADYVWRNPDLFYKMMPKSVVLSNWYYGEEFDLTKLDGVKRDKEQVYSEYGEYFSFPDKVPSGARVQAYLDLNMHGYDQVPTSSNDGVFYSHGKNTNSMQNTVEFCSKHISDERLKGFLQTLWVPTIEKYRDNILEGIELVGLARKQYEKNNKTIK